MRATISGIRGVFGADLGTADVMEYARAFAALTGGRCAVGRDTRPSGPMAAEAAKAGLMAGGADVHDLGVAPTPVVFREARTLGAGLVVTSSHNPVEWNGLKFALGGRGITGAELGRILEQEGFPAPSVGTESQITSAYVADAARLIGRAGGRPAVAVDPGGGSAAGTAPGLLEKIGCSVSVINDTMQSSSRGPDPTTDGLGDLRNAAGDGLGLAFDLDGDRLVVVHGGRVQSPDTTLALGVAWALARGDRSFVLSVDTSAGVERMIRDAGGTVHRSAVGEASVARLMAETGAQAGGEGSSGGFILPEFNWCRDGILAAGIIAAMDQGRLDGVARHMSGYFQARRRVRADAAEHASVMARLEKRFREEYSEVSSVDGLRGAADGGWVLVRPSNTEDAIRVSAEAGSEEGAEGLAAACEGMVKDA